MKRSIFAFAFLLSSTAIAAESDGHFNAGMKAYDAGDFQKATEEMSASMAAHPTAAASLYLGNAYLKLGQLDKAKDALALTLKLEPNTPKREKILTLIRGIDGRILAKVTVTSTPPGATVYIDSESTTARGKTPLEITVPAGDHQIVTVLDGYDVARTSAQFSGGQTSTMAVDLVIKGCDVALTADPAGSRASVDGAAPVQLPATVRVTKGAHKVSFSGEKLATQELPVQCDGASPVSLSTALLATGRVKIPVAAGSVVRIDGKVVALTPEDAAKGVGLPVGRHEVTVTNEGAPPWTTTIDVVADSDVMVSVPKNDAPVSTTSLPAIYVGVQGAGNVALREWNLGSNAFISRDGAHGIHPGTSALAGARVGVQVLPRLAVEGEFHWIGLPNQVDTSQGLTYGANVVFNVLKSNWTPIVEAGFGAYQVVSGKLGSDVSPRVHVGIGLRGKLTDSLSLRLDVRDVASRGFDSTGSNNVEFLGGLEMLLWRPQPSPSASAAAPASRSTE